jgi:hypothetical protein
VGFCAHLHCFLCNKLGKAKHVHPVEVTVVEGILVVWLWVIVFVTLLTPHFFQVRRASLSSLSPSSSSIS